MEHTDVIALLRQEIGLNPDSIGEGAVQRAVQQRRVATNCPSVADYVARLASSADEMQELVEEITVPETWFFREESAFECLRQQAHTRWLQLPAARPFLVACLPCSTGEEPYSIAMALLTMGLPAARFRVHALDISYRALLQAQQGVYRDYSFRGADNSFRPRYFEATPAGYRLNQSIRDQVSFYQGNALALPPPFAGGAYEAVFCRNLLIYLDPAARERLIAEFKRILSPSGILLVGHAEVSILLQAGFMRRADGALTLCQESEQPAPGDDSSIARQRLPTAAKPRQPLPPLPAAPRPVPVQPAAVTVPDEIGAIRALADAGRLAEARACGEKLLAAGQRGAELYFVLGLISQAQGNKQAAHDCYRRAVYLEPQHAEAGVQLALLLEQSGETERARSLRESQAKKRGGVNERQAVGG